MMASAAKARREAHIAAMKDATPVTFVTDTVAEPEYIAGAGYAGLHEALDERVHRLERELQDARERVRLETEGREAADAAQAAVETELARLRGIASQSDGASREFLFLDPIGIVDPLPADRFPIAFADSEFQQLREDIRVNGQNEPITVRRRGEEGSTQVVYEIASGRRRLAACRVLGIDVLARVRDLDDGAMLRAQFGENEHRSDVGALERARWFAEIQRRRNLTAGQLGEVFGVDRSTMAHYLRLSALPIEIIQRLRDPRKVSMQRGRRLLELLDRDADAFGRVLAALDTIGDSDDDVAIAIGAAEGLWVRRDVRSRPQARQIVREGKRVATLSNVDGRWRLNFASEVDPRVIQRLADCLPELLAKLAADEAGGDTAV
jgi:ParB family chromosome partitioning protein